MTFSPVCFDRCTDHFRKITFLGYITHDDPTRMRFVKIRVTKIQYPYNYYYYFCS